MEACDVTRQNDTRTPTSGGRFKRTFTSAQLDEIKQYVSEIDKQLFGMTATQCRQLAFEYADRNNIPHQFNKDQRMTGYDWLRSFWQECNISFRIPEATSIARALGFKKVEVGHFFRNLKQVREQNTFGPHRIQC